MSKVKKIIIYSLIILISISIITVLYLKTDLFKTKEQLFWKYFLEEKDEIANVLSNDETKEYNKKIKESSYIKEGNININCENNLINPININITEKGNKKEEYKNIIIDFSYNDNENKTTTIKDDNYYIVKNDLLGKDYIGFENNNLKQLAKNLGIINTKYIPNQIREIDYAQLFDFEDEDLNYISKKYVPICRKVIKSKNYIKEENVEIENKTGKYVTYKVEITEKQFNNLIIELLKELANDEKTLQLIAEKIKIIDEENDYCDINNLKLKIEEIKTNFEHRKASDEIFLSIIIYKNENGVEKTEFVLNNDRTISIQNDGENRIVLKQYNNKNRKIKLTTIEEIVKTILNSVSEIVYEKKIENSEINKVNINIKCDLIIDTVNINYNYVKQIKNNVDDIVKKDEIDYVDINKFTNETWNNIIEKVLKIDMFKTVKNY